MSKHVCVCVCVCIYIHTHTHTQDKVLEESISVEFASVKKTSSGGILNEIAMAVGKHYVICQVQSTCRGK